MVASAFGMVVDRRSQDVERAATIKKGGRRGRLKKFGKLPQLRRYRRR